MSIYTYVVDHKGASPSVGASDKINGGVIISLSFENSHERIQELEAFINSLRDKTICEQTKYAIDDFMH